MAALVGRAAAFARHGSGWVVRTPSRGCRACAGERNATRFPVWRFGGLTLDRQTSLDARSAQRPTPPLFTFPREPANGVDSKFQYPRRHPNVVTLERADLISPFDQQQSVRPNLQVRHYRTSRLRSRAPSMVLPLKVAASMLSVCWFRKSLCTDRSCGASSNAVIAASMHSWL